MEEEYVGEATASDDLERIEDEIMQSFEALYLEPHRPAIAQVAAVVERLFEQTRQATKRIQVDNERLSLMNQRLEASQQHAQDLQAELRTAKKNHDQLLDFSETEWQKEKNLLLNDCEKNAVEFTRQKEVLLGHIAEFEATVLRNESLIEFYVKEMKNLEEQLENVKEDLHLLRQANRAGTLTARIDPPNRAETVTTRIELGNRAGNLTAQIDPPNRTETVMARIELGNRTGTSTAQVDPANRTGISTARIDPAISREEIPLTSEPASFRDSALSSDFVAESLEFLVSDNSDSSSATDEAQSLVDPESDLEFDVTGSSSGGDVDVLNEDDLVKDDTIAPPVGESLGDELKTVFLATATNLTIIGDVFSPKPIEIAKFLVVQSAPPPAPPLNTPDSISKAVIPFFGPSTKKSSALNGKRHLKANNWFIRLLFFVGIYFLLDRICEQLFGVGIFRISKRPPQILC